MTDFPNRPEHDDFWTLCMIVQDLDSAADDAGFDRLVGPIIDIPSLLYMTEQRALRAVVNSSTEEFIRIQATWLDGFILGAMFQKRREQS